MTSVGQNPNEASFRDVIRVDESQVRAHVDELVRASVEQTLNGLLDAEADELCGAARYERSPDRVDSRAGSYHRKLLTKAGEVQLKVPRLRSLPFETQIIERYRRRESSVEEALVEMYLAGVSVRRVEDITEALWGERVSPSTVSELNQKIYAQIETWRNRPLEGEHAYVFLDGIWLKRSWGGEVKTVAVAEVLGSKRRPLNRKHMQRLMRLMGLEAIYPKPHTTQRDASHKIYPYLLRNLAITRPNQVWSCDITYVPMPTGFMYLTAVIDWFSRYVLAWGLSNTLDGGFCIEALESACTKVRPEIFNTDQGVQFTSRA